MEMEGSWMRLNYPASVPYPELDKSSPRPPSYLLKVRFNIIFSSSTPPKTCMHLYCLAYMQHDSPISFFMKWSPA